jgi:thiosulfate dehydrogenase (quinone) large subunit
MIAVPHGAIMTPSEDLPTAGAAAELALDARIAYAILRLTLGINIALHGITRIVNGTGEFAEVLATQFQATLLPRILVEAFAHTLPWAETTIGLLLLAGLTTRFALIAGGLLMALLTFGTTLRQDFQTAGLQLFYSIAYFVLLSLRSRNGFSLDAWLHGRSTPSNASV